MRFLIDESLSEQVAQLLVGAGHDALHVGDLDLLGAADEVVMKAAANSTRVLVSADTDFGELLALNRHPGPSVVILRRLPHRPGRQAQLLLGALPELETSLDEGAVVSLNPGLARVRRLPITGTSSP